MIGRTYLERVSWWRWYLRGTWAIARHGGPPSLVLADLAAGLRWYRANPRRDA